MLIYFGMKRRLTNDRLTGDLFIAWLDDRCADNSYLHGFKCRN